jgi:hypothetical protein
MADGELLLLGRLEGRVEGVETRLGRVEVRLETLATREDVRDLRDLLEDDRTSLVDLRLDDVREEAALRERLAALEARRSTRPRKASEPPSGKALAQWWTWIVVTVATLLLGAGAALARACGVDPPH